MTIIAIIPARFASTRFPGKPLVDLGGKPIIQRVYERVKEIIPNVAVATDDQRIYDCVAAFGGRAVMTRDDHQSGTDRCFEAYQNLGGNEDIIVNVQGDEPFIAQSHLTLLKSCFADERVQIATLVKAFGAETKEEELFNPNSPKVVLDSDGFALYFSRSVIPYLRGVEPENWAKTHTYFKHIGLYAFRSEVLAQLTRLPQSKLEKAESLEQLRWLENGYSIKAAQTDCETVGIDTPEDLKRAEEYLNSCKN